MSTSNSTVRHRFRGKHARPLPYPFVTKNIPPGPLFIHSTLQAEIATEPGCTTLRMFLAMTHSFLPAFVASRFRGESGAALMPLTVGKSLLDFAEAWAKREAV